MTFASEPLDAQQADEPVLPQRPRTRTPPFRFLVALVALIGLAATVYGSAGQPFGSITSSSFAPEQYVFASEQAGFILTCVFFAVCVAGLWLTRSNGALLRVGLILRAVALLGTMLLVFPVVLLAVSRVNYGAYSAVISFYLALSFLYTTPSMQFFQLALGILGVLSQLCFSYSLARWQASDKVFLWVQLVFALGLVGLIVQQDYPYFYSGIPWAFVLQIVGGAFLSGVSAACFLLRPACWKASPLIVLCFTVGTVVSLLFSEVVQRFIYRAGSSPIHILQITYAISLVSATLVIVGAMLLIQRSRGQKPLDTHNLTGDGAWLTQPEQDAPDPGLAGEG